MEVLFNAKELGFIGAIAPILEELNELRFHIDIATRQSVLKLASKNNVS
ncbi:DUF3368 domain-containing protein [Leptolyngbyaceae cyanobacterium UHCC 1019]